MQLYMYLIIIRALDVLTTHLCVSKYGSIVEGNPLARVGMNNSYIVYMLFNVVISALVIYLSTKDIRLLNIALKVFLILNIVVVIINTWCCFM